MTATLGLHRGMSWADYRALDAINASVLVEFRRSPAHARVAMLTPEDTRALIVGEAIHAAVFEPERFEARYPVPPDVDGRTKDGKAAWAEWNSRYPQAVPLKYDEHAAILPLRDSVRNHPVAGPLISGRGMNEVTAVWEDRETGLLCKGRMDRITVGTVDDLDGWTVVVDLKTTTDARYHAFSSACEKYSYHAKAAFYLDGLAAIDPRPRRFVHVAVEKDPPYAVAVYEMLPETIQQGRVQIRAALTQYKACRESGSWPAYATDIQALDLPKWAQVQEHRETTE